MMRFDRFTERAQEAAQRAAEIIQRYGHNQIDTEHILLSLLEQPDGQVPQILVKMGADVELIKQRLDDVLQAGPRVGIYGGGAGQVFITPRVKRIIDVANEEANRLKDEYISTEHIFLAVLSERNTPVARLLSEMGVTKERILSAVAEAYRTLAGAAEERFVEKKSIFIANAAPAADEGAAQPDQDARETMPASSGLKECCHEVPAL